jgi:hypothetical protein
MDALEDVVEIHAVYGFTNRTVIDLETIDSEWLDAHCDVVGFARSRTEIPPGLWLADGFGTEVSCSRLVAAVDERARRTSVMKRQRAQRTPQQVVPGMT